MGPPPLLSLSDMPVEMSGEYDCYWMNAAGGLWGVWLYLMEQETICAVII